MLLLLSSTALAWNHTGWLVDPMPLIWHRAEGAPEGVDEGVFAAAFEGAFQQWAEAGSCTTLEADYGGIVTGKLDSFDGISAIYPSDDSAGGSVTVTFTTTSNDLVFSANGMDYYASTGSDIAFRGTGVIAEVDLEDCTDEQVLERVALKTTGLMLGLSYTCEAGSACSDLEEQAVMYWLNGECEPRGLNADDIAGLEALYIPRGEIVLTDTEDLTEVDGTYRGVVPVELCMAASSNADMASVSWDLGDGETSTEPGLCHTWDAAGDYTVRMSFLPDLDDCTDLDGGSVELVLCDALEDAPFEVTDQGGGLVALDSLTEPSGCVDTADWLVTDEGGAEVWSSDGWSTDAYIPDAGTYTATLTISGVAGEASAAQTFTASGAEADDPGTDPDPEVEEAGGCGSKSVIFLGLPVLLGLRRRASPG
jgi:hypothetical protein